MRLAAFLKKKKLSVASLADELGISPTAAYRYLSGARIPDPVVMHRLRVLSLGSVTADDFYEDAAGEAGASRRHSG